MKKVLLPVIGLLFLLNFAQAQVIENFNTPGSLGIFKDAVWGSAASPSITDSIYQTVDPSGKSAGVLGVKFDLKGYAQHNAIRPVTQSWLNPNGAQMMTYWVFIPKNSGIPDSLTIELWWQVNGNWTWNAVDFYPIDIPKGVWYPLSAPIAQAAVASPTNSGFLSGHILGDFGIQWNNDHDSSAVWKGDIYFDNVSMIGAKPT